MKSQKIILILIVSILILSLYRCKTEEIILHGEISGIVTDTTTSQPLQAVAVKLNPLEDFTSTGSDGKYLFKSLIPGDYDIEVSKPPYATGVRTAIVTSANTTPIDFALHQIAYPEVSPKHLDFGSDSKKKSFTITNTGTGILDYSITTTSKDWITVNPNIGEITTEPQIINVTIDRTGLSEKKHVEWVEIVFHVGRDLVQDTIHVFLNGVMDQDYNYYNIVTIGTQTWMAENLNTGRQVFSSSESSDNGIIEKYCYNNNKSNCEIYGGLYTWPEAMNYLAPDTGKIGTTRGVCPVGWHIPTGSEWLTLKTYLDPQAGAALKETGFAHWESPNLGATNITNFTALGAGGYFVNDCLRPYENEFSELGQITNFLSSETRLDFPGYAFSVFMTNGSTELRLGMDGFCTGDSVRCIKDPPKNK
jgi:uncharacterized protein (TIGR02145 family)